MATFLMMVCFTIIRVFGYCQKKIAQEWQKNPDKIFLTYFITNCKHCELVFVCF